MEKKKVILYTAAAVIVLGGGYALLGGKKAEGKVGFSTEKATVGTISNSITATGTIEPVTEVEVGTQVSGIIDKIYIDYNSTVTKGQLIAEMDKVTLQSELQSASASYNGSKAEFDYQKKLYERNKQLHEKQLISETDFEQTEYNYLRAKSSLESAKAALAKAERNLSYATITSPIDGIVTSRDVEEGQTVASGFETPTLFTIAADLTKMQVVADVDEADIADVKEGARVSFTVDAYPDDVFEGQVSQVRLGSTNSSSSTTTSTTVVTYEVVITADNPDLKLKPRLTANATIYTLEKENVLTVPNKALRFTPNKQVVKGYKIVDCDADNKVWTVDGKTLTAHAVKIGLNDGTNTEILDGLTANTNIVTGTEIITEGAAPAGDEEASEESTTESNPFMPTPPGKKKNNK
jgi:HlyD family secretion protein